MATNKNASIRYIALDKCFRNPGRKYYMEDLIEVCNDALLDIDPETSGVKRRQIYDDIKFMRDSKGYDAPIESFKDGRKAYYRYSDMSFSINNQPLNEQEAQQLQSSLATLSRFSGLPQFAWIEELSTRLEHEFKLASNAKVIAFEENPYLKGLDFLKDLYTAIVNEQVLEIIYQPFSWEKEKKTCIHPYYLKQYNNRWYCLGLNDTYKSIENLSLDRIVSFQVCKKSYIKNTSVDFEEHFEDVVGVTIPANAELEEVRLKINKKLLPYIKTKPIHGSQRVEEKEDYALVKLQLYINYELKSKILAHGDQVEVIEPKALREEIAEKIQTIYKMYF